MRIGSIFELLKNKLWAVQYAETDIKLILIKSGIIFLRFQIVAYVQLVYPEKAGVLS
jgi:hypothetical protein